MSATAKFRPFFATAVFLLSVTCSLALVVDDTTTQNLTAPANGAPWANVGAGNGASGVYLKNGWVISARHVFSGATAGAINFGGTTYSGGPIYVLNNPDSSASASDVVVFNIGGKPAGMTEIGVSTSTPIASSSTTLTLIGYGAKRNGGLATITYTGGTANGYLWDGTGGSTKSWGNNTRSRFSSVSSVQASGANAFQAFYTTFTANGSSGTTQGALGDSGGGVFVNSSGSWLLAGTINAIGGYTDQQGSTAANGDATYVADMASYATQINAHISSTALAPVLSGASPNFLVTAGSAQTFTLVGSNFASGATVEISTSGGLVTSGTTFVDTAHLSVSTTASTAQTWSLRVINPDGVPSGSINLPIYAAQTFANYLAAYPSLTGDNALATADPDGDGLSNLQEYAFGSNPTVPASSSSSAPVSATATASASAPVFATETINGQENITLTYAKDLAKTDLTYQPQMSTDLTQPWTNISDTILDTSGTIEHHKVSVAITGSAAFLRIDVTK